MDKDFEHTRDRKYWFWSAKLLVARSRGNLSLHQEGLEDGLLEAKLSEFMFAVTA